MIVTTNSLKWFSTFAEKQIIKKSWVKHRIFKIKLPMLQQQNDGLGSSKLSSPTETFKRQT